MTLLDLNLRENPIGQEGADRLGKGLVGNNRLQSLDLSMCQVGNDGLANLLSAADEGMINNSLANLHLDRNGIDGADGGRKLTLLLQRFRALKVLSLRHNRLGPLGAQELALGIAVASQLQVLNLVGGGLGHEGVANLVPDGQVNRTLTSLDIRGDSRILGLDGRENVIALASRCTNLDRLDSVDFRPDQQRRLDLLFERKRLCTAATALAGSTFPVLYRFLEKEAHSHEHGLSAIFVILQNDGEDYFYNANNRAMAY